MASPSSRPRAAFAFQFSKAFGPQGEVVEPTQFATGDIVEDVRVGPGPIFTGTEPHFSTTAPPSHRPVYWPTPGLARVSLPADGCVTGPVPQQVDAQQRIAGYGLDPELPVLWVPGADGHALQLLPLIEGGARGATSVLDVARR